MQGLLLRLSTFDEDVESAVRLISFFDHLIEMQPTVTELLRHAAALAECSVGVQHDDERLVFRAAPDGTVDAVRAGSGATVLASGDGHELWIERGGPDALPLDLLLIERLGIAFMTVLNRERTARPAFGDPGLLELVVASSTGVPERSRALSLLGLTAATALTFLAVRGSDEHARELCGALDQAGRRVRRATMGPVHAIAVVGPVERVLDVPRGATVGVSATQLALDAPTSWEAALRALRFAVPASEAGGLAAQPWVRSADLGAFDLLAATLTPADIASVGDVDALDDLATLHGDDLIVTLEVVVRSESLREAARKLFLHHNSVAGRLARAEDRLGFRITEPSGTARLGLALVLRRLRDAELPT